ncbi:MAG TPA: hypothetical protein VJ201_00065 [Candidatus Babeliales bacterium]|nr:hypothetical protein [Candidatus Babeliales bacterium]HLC06936.1 hypothetical protein [Candidatus Babeliales bacterium]
MKRLKYFMQCYFNQSFNFSDLDKRINDFKQETASIQEEFIRELYDIISIKNYFLADQIIKKYGELELDNLEEVKVFINYLYDKLLNKSTKVKAKDFEGDTNFS